MRETIDGDEYSSLAIVDTNTGEFIRDINVGDVVIDRETILNKKKRADTYSFNFDKGVRFVKLYTNVLKELKKQLTPSEFIFCIMISEFVCYDDCILRYGGHHNGKALRMKDMAELLEMDYQAVRRSVNGLVSKGVLAYYVTGNLETKEVNAKAIAFNPYIYSRGNKIEKYVLELFKDSGWVEFFEKE